MASSREERRKRILERGNDRLALITGRIHPSSSPLSSPSVNQCNNSPRFPLIDQINAIPEPTNNASASKLIKQETNDSISGKKRTASRPQEEHHDETSREALQPSIMNKETQNKTSDDKHSIPKPRSRQPRFFTSKRLNSCIIASEDKRNFCALVIALLVVLSYVDVALFGVNLVQSESILASRPLYIILVTDATIVLALMYRQAQSPDESEDEKGQQNKDGQQLDRAIRLMERGLVVYQVIRGLFIDFSVYSVIVICGLSLV
ncbi:hypothetical protein ACFE04_004032 [Oxalis oulophora]